MSWIFGGKGGSNPAIPSTTPIQQQRLKQIKSLQNQNQNVTEIKRDAEYQVLFGGQYILHIHLPPDFPNCKPRVLFSPPSYHSLIDSNTMEISGFPSLSTFYMHSDLGKIIQQLVKEFKKNPPVLKNLELPPVPSGFATPNFQSAASPPVANLVNTSPEEALATTSQSTDSRPPAYGSVHKIVGEKSVDNELNEMLKDIQNLPKSELEKICNDPDVLIERVETMQAVENLKEKRRTLIEENEKIAKQTMELEPVIDDLKGNLKETFEEYNELYYGFQEKSRKQDELAQIYDFGNILTNLRIGIMQGEEESEKVADDFLNGDIALDSFVSSYVEKRKEYHLRRAKEERIKCLVPH